MFFIGQCAAYLIITESLSLNDYIDIKIQKQIAFTDLIISVVQENRSKFAKPYLHPDDSSIELFNFHDLYTYYDDNFDQKTIEMG